MSSSSRVRRSPAPSVQAAELARRAWNLEYTGHEWINNLALGAIIDGPVDLAALRRALAAVTMRHEALRTTFEEAGKHYFSRVGLTPPSVLTVRDLSRSGASADPEAALRNAQRHSFRGARESLLKVDVCRVGCDRHVLTLAVDHLIADGWSLGLLARDLGALYDCVLGGGAPDLPRVDMQFSQFARWRDREKLAEAHVAYWAATLCDLGPVPQLTLPGAKVDLLTGDLRADIAQRDLPEDDANRYRVAHRRFGVTESAFWLASVASASFLLTGQRRLGYLVPVAGRTLPGTEQTVGWLANTVVIVVALPQTPTYATVLDLTWRALLGSLDHQVVPWDDLVENWYARQPSRSTTSGIPPQMFFSAIAPCEVPALELANATVIPIPTTGRPSAHALDLRVLSPMHGCPGSLIATYPSELYDRGSIEAFLHLVQRCADALCEHPDQALARA